MTYSISINGAAGSRKAEAQALSKAVALAKDLGAEGAFSFNGDHIAINASAPDDAVALAEQALADYAADADADDQVPTMMTRSNAP